MPYRNKSFDTADTIIMMAIGIALMFASIMGVLFPTPAANPLVLILCAVAGIATFWAPVIITSLED